MGGCRGRSGRGRRKRRVGQPLLVPGLCLPKALQPVLPIYLQGVLQVRPCRSSWGQSCTCYGAVRCSALLQTLRVYLHRARCVTH